MINTRVSAENKTTSKFMVCLYWTDLQQQLWSVNFTFIKRTALPNPHLVDAIRRGKALPLLPLGICILAVPIAADSGQQVCTGCTSKKLITPEQFAYMQSVCISALDEVPCIRRNGKVSSTTGIPSTDH
jgi:hypothetical protein